MSRSFFEPIIFFKIQFMMFPVFAKEGEKYSISRPPSSSDSHTFRSIAAVKCVVSRDVICPLFDLVST
jgi:hypothetical protein